MAFDGEAVVVREEVDPEARDEVDVEVALGGGAQRDAETDKAEDGKQRTLATRVPLPRPDLGPPPQKGPAVSPR